ERDVVAAPALLDLGALPRGDVGAGDDGAPLGSAEGHHRHREPALAARRRRRVLEGEARTGPAEDLLHPGEELDGPSLPPRGGPAAALDVARARGGLEPEGGGIRRPPRPGLVDRDD